MRPVVSLLAMMLALAPHFARASTIYIPLVQRAECYVDGESSDLCLSYEFGTLNGLTVEVLQLEEGNLNASRQVDLSAYASELGPGHAVVRYYNPDQIELHVTFDDGATVTLVLDPEHVWHNASP